MFSNKNLLCKKINLKCSNDCKKAHSCDELLISKCKNDKFCEKLKCPFIHTDDPNITKEEYYKRMYDYISPYETTNTSICRYIYTGCKIDNCRKAHSVKELVLSKCDCFRSNCIFYHEERDKNLTKEEYFERMKTFLKILKKSDKNLLCRYINIGCQRKDCPYAHNIDELNIHKCIFKNCKSSCVYLHEEVVNKFDYFQKMLKYIEPLQPKTVLCHLKNCENINCNYAHSFKELILTYCVRGIKCKKHCCPFKHPHENLNKTVYYERMVKSLYPN